MPVQALSIAGHVRLSPVGLLSPAPPAVTETYAWAIRQRSLTREVKAEAPPPSASSIIIITINSNSISNSRDDHDDDNHDYDFLLPAALMDSPRESQK